MRDLLQTMINALLCADADAVVGAEYGRPSPGRTAQHNSYRHRDLDTRVGTIDIAIPKLRKGTYFPDWLLERRKRAETALITVVADCYLAGVSTRRMDKLVKTLGIDPLSKSQVSRMAAELDEHVEPARTHRLTPSKENAALHHYPGLGQLPAGVLQPSLHLDMSRGSETLASNLPHLGHAQRPGPVVG